MDLTTRRTLEEKVVYAEDGTPRTILYAEDDPATRELNYSMLSVMGFTVDAVENGQSAISLANQNQYDFVVLDLDMPLADGFEVARQIRTGAGQSRHAKILALSGFVHSAHTHADWNKHIDGFLPKPTSRQGIRAAVLKIMEKDLQSSVLAGRKRNSTTGHVLQKTVPVLDMATKPPMINLNLPALPVRQSVPVPTTVPKSWRGFGSGLPEDFAQVVEKLAVVQAHAYIVDISKGFKAKDDRAVLNARSNLNSLASSFEMFDILRVLSLNFGATIGQQSNALIAALATWQADRFKLAQAA